MVEQDVTVADLILDFVEALKTKSPYIEKSRKYNKLLRYLGPLELEGLREAWAYYETPRADVYPYVFDDTINYLVERYKKVKVYQQLY